MKKIIIYALCLCLVLSFSGCKKDDLFEDEEVLFDVTMHQVSQDSQSDSDSSSTNDGSLQESSQQSSSEENESNKSSSALSDSTPVDTLSESPSTESSSSQSESSTQSSAEDTSGSDKKDVLKNEDGGTNMELIQVDGYYFPDIDELYKLAAEIYYELTSGNLPVDWDLGRYEFTVDGSTNTYWRISDPRFDSVAELEAYLNAYFTEEFIKTFYDASLFYDFEGHLYAVTGVSGENVLYAGHEFKLTKQTTKRVFFDCISYFYKSLEEIPNNNEPFYKTPDDISKYDTKTVSFVLEVDESGYNWRFSKFDNIK